MSQKSGTDDKSAADRPDSQRICFFGLELRDSALPGLDEVGGKGMNLCKLTHARFPVPPGFVVTTAAYRQFIEDNNLVRTIRELAGTIDEKDVAALSATAGRIRKLFTDAPMPGALAEVIRTAYRRLKDIGDERVAVRSSATAEDLPEASFAGQQDTYLNIHGEEAMLEAVQSCWASLWTDRAVAYRAKHKVDLEGLAMAVVVQQMVPAEAAGVLFTANPVTGGDDEIVINATWGLGEAIVSGHVTPDHIVVDKPTGRVREITVSDKTVMTAMTRTGTVEAEVSEEQRHARVLDDAAVHELAEIGRRVEEHYKSPQDIEWAWGGGRFSVLQARPIQGLQVARDVEAGRQDEIARLRRLAGDRQRAWVIHNLDETLASPTPMTWSIVRRFMSGDGGFGQMYRDFGYEPSQTVCEEGFLELICGRIYADPERAAGLFWKDVPLEYNVADILADQTTLERAPTKLNVEQADPGFFLRLPQWVFKLIRSGRRMKRARREAYDRFHQQALPKFLDFVEKARATDLSKLTCAQLIGELERRRDYVMGEFANESLKPGFFGGLAQGQMLGTLAQLMGDVKGEDLGRTLTMGLDGDTTMEQNVLLFKVARGEATMDDFIDRFGHRANGEMELANPRWREDRSYLEQMVETYKGAAMQSPESRHHDQRLAREQAERDLLATLGEWGGASLHEKVVVELKDAQKLLPYRESGKHYLMMGYETLRSVLLELGRRWKIGRDVFFLRIEELAGFEAERAARMEDIAARKIRWESARKLSPGNVIDSADLDGLGLVELAGPKPKKKAAEGEEGEADDDALQGRPIASGAATGIARIVFDPAKAGDIGRGYILVCPSTDPGWTPLFVNAAGLVVERGGILSHGAIVARDFGIPAVVCENATRLITDNSRISIDGGNGRIVRL